jgi:hypothetical protein
MRILLPISRSRGLRATLRLGVFVGLALLPLASSAAPDEPDLNAALQRLMESKGNTARRLGEKLSRDMAAVRHPTEAGERFDQTVAFNSAAMLFTHQLRQQIRAQGGRQAGLSPSRTVINGHEVHLYGTGSSLRFDVTAPDGTTVTYSAHPESGLPIRVAKLVTHTEGNVFGRVRVNLEGTVEMTKEVGSKNSVRVTARQFRGGSLLDTTVADEPGKPGDPNRAAQNHVWSLRAGSTPNRWGKRVGELMKPAQLPGVRADGTRVKPLRAKH